MADEQDPDQLVPDDPAKGQPDHDEELNQHLVPEGYERS